MITAATTIVSSWYKHEEYGINALLPNVPRFKLGNDGPKHPAPPPVTIYDDINDADLEKGGDLQPPRSPAIVVFADSDMEIAFGREGVPQTGSGLVVVTAYIVNDVGIRSKVKLNAGFTLRAARRSLTKLNTGKYSDGFREHNGIKLVKINSVLEQRVMGAVGKSTLVGFMVGIAWMNDHDA
jgi:hypothetical protein